MGTGRDITKRKEVDDKTKRRILELSTLIEIGRAIASTIKLDELWELIYKQTCRVIEISDFYIALYDREKEELYNVINMLHGQPRPQGEKRRRFGNGRTEYVIRTNKPLLIRGEVKATYDRLGIITGDRRAKSYAGVPIAIGVKVIGVLAVQNYEREDTYDKHTIKLLSTIANHAAIAIENARLYNEAQRHLKEMTTLQKVGMELTSSLDLSNLLQGIAESTLELTNGDYVHIFSLDPKTSKFTERAAAWPPHAKKHPITWPRKTGLTATVFKTQKPVIIEKATDHPLYSTPDARKWGVQSVAGFPLRGKWGLTGVLNLVFLQPHAFSKEERDLLSLLADQAAVAIENSRLYEETKRLATTDHLTGVWNRRYLDEHFQTELVRAHRFRRQVSVLVIDIDNFKLFNDTYGHLSGDEVICNVAQAILTSCREIDLVGRYGGDEFAVILLETDTSVAAHIAKRILTALEKEPFSAPNEAKIPINVSIGIASYPSDGKKAGQLFSLADAAMYRAKLAGGGQFASLTTSQEEVAKKTAAPFDVIMRLLMAVDSKDNYTLKHSQEVTRRACTLAREIQLSKEEISALEVAGKLHDIGKIGIPTSILKKPGPFTPEEWKIVQEHPYLGFIILQQLPQTETVFQALLHHHERYDGKGYPSGLEGDKIPFLSRILALADAFSAMTTGRPHRKALTVEEALGEMRRNMGKQFDPKLAQKFVKLIEKGKIK
jgi:diguanylate cyclase (GGDEF)-like protein